MMRKIVICWIFIAGFLACSHSYIKMMYINTDNGYCEYLNGLLIPVNDYAFDVEKCERIYCQPGRIRITGCVPVVFISKHNPSVSCTLVRGKGILECCPTIPKCQVIGPLPENYSFPKHWIIEDYGNFTQVPSNEDTSEKGEYEEDSAEKKYYEEDSAEEDKFENDYEEDSAEEGTFENDYEEDSAEEGTFEYDNEEDSVEEGKKFENDYDEDLGEGDKLEKVTSEKYRAEKYEFAEYTTEEVTTRDDATEKTQDPLLSEINRYARNYPVS